MEQLQDFSEHSLEQLMVVRIGFCKIAVLTRIYTLYTGTAVGNPGKIIKTINSGISWNFQSSPVPFSLRSVFFINENTGFIAGHGGLIMKTIDGGEVWNIQTIGVYSPLKSIFFVNADTGFAVGEYGTILKTITGGTIGIKKISSIIPEKSYLHQNYPNPFNPATVIKFDIHAKSNIKLSVFDITGKEIELLVDKELTSGSYEIIWNARQSEPLTYPSGIYFYRMLSNDFIQSKKMLYIK
jgi:hypothetical protein